jgi:hypothetical protein
MEGCHIQMRLIRGRGWTWMMHGIVIGCRERRELKISRHFDFRASTEHPYCVLDLAIALEL